jgi:hypothetical protein
MLADLATSTASTSRRPPPPVEQPAADDLVEVEGGAVVGGLTDAGLAEIEASG